MAEDQGRKVTFFYEHSPLCRAIPAHGAFGSVTPELSIYMALYSEHRPVPKRTQHVFSRDGDAVTDTEVDREIRDGFVRQIEAEVYLSVETAISLRDWRNDKISLAQKAREASESAQAES